jgi:hypothetical protein
MADLQREQHERGRRSAELVRCHGSGWAIRYASSLDNYALIPGAWNRHSHSRKMMVEAGIAWANEDPNNREFFARIDHLDPNQYAEDGTRLNTGEEL